MTRDPKVVPPGDVVFNASDAEADLGKAPPSPHPESKILPHGMGLEAVPLEAIDTYASQLRIMCGLPEDLKLFFAYFCGATYDKAIQSISINTKYKMAGQDAIEAIRVVTGVNILDNHTLDGIVLVDPLHLEDSVDINLNAFPEMTDISKYLIKNTSRQKQSPYFDLLKLPARGRTFFAGALYEKFQNNIVYTSTEITATSKISLPLSTRDLVGYSTKIGLQEELSNFMKMLAK